MTIGCALQAKKLERRKSKRRGRVPLSILLGEKVQTESFVEPFSKKETKKARKGGVRELKRG